MSLNHTSFRIKIIRDNISIPIEIPVIYIPSKGLLRPLIDYFLKYHRSKSPYWMQRTVFCIKLLLDYISVLRNEYDEPMKLFESFVDRLSSGTIDEKGYDYSGLGWESRIDRDVRDIVKHITYFFDWNAEENNVDSPNPWGKATKAEEILNWAAYCHRHQNAFLGHTWNHSQQRIAAKKSHHTKTEPPPKYEMGAPNAFPDRYFLDLLIKGFINPGNKDSYFPEDRYNIRNILITLLMGCAGLRLSETMHLWVHDVIENPNNKGLAYVRIYHPVDGDAPPDWIGRKKKSGITTRREYLRHTCDMLPRNKYPFTHTLYAGWKNPTLDNSTHNFMHLHWFPQKAGELFWMLWNRYMFQRGSVNVNHPFAFISKSGEPYNIRSYQYAFKLAIEHIGLVSLKSLGTTPHGQRHAMVQRLRRANIHKEVIRKILHHKSVTSQSVYKNAGVDEISEILNKSTDHLSLIDDSIEAFASNEHDDFMLDHELFKGKILYGED